MSFDLAVLAMDAAADARKAQAMFERCCHSRRHDEGELDGRVVAFYEALRSRFPDYPPHDPGSPWMSPLDVGIDHVIMNLSFSPRSTPAIETVLELATEHGLVVWDPQSQDAYLPGTSPRQGARPGSCGAVD